MLNSIFDKEGVKGKLKEIENGINHLNELLGELQELILLKECVLEDYSKLEETRINIHLRLLSITRQTTEILASLHTLMKKLTETKIGDV